jgi:hypothetical protein
MSGQELFNVSGVKTRKNDAIPTTRTHDFLTQNTKIFSAFIVTQ